MTHLSLVLAWLGAVVVMVQGAIALWSDEHDHTMLRREHSRGHKHDMVIDPDGDHYEDKSFLETSPATNTALVANTTNTTNTTTPEPLSL